MLDFDKILKPNFLCDSAKKSVKMSLKLDILGSKNDLDNWIHCIIFIVPTTFCLICSIAFSQTIHMERGVFFPAVANCYCFLLCITGKRDPHFTYGWVFLCLTTLHHQCYIISQKHRDSTLEDYTIDQLNYINNTKNKFNCLNNSWNHNYSQNYRQQTFMVLK